MERIDWNNHSKKLSNEKYEEIKKEAINLLEDYGMNKLPIDPFLLLKKMGIEVIPYSKAPYEECMKLSEDAFILINRKDVLKSRIYYNDAQIKQRINMTLFHEVGHIQLEHRGLNPIKVVNYDINSEYSEDEELEAKFFAKYISAPPVLVEAEGCREYEEISDKFDISPTAAINQKEYYEKWRKQCDKNGLKDYEMITLQTFYDVDNKSYK